jgi:hypothetical protein
MAIKNLEAIAKALRIDPAKLLEASKSDQEVEVEVPADLVVMTKAEQETRENSLKSTNIGIGKEIIIKELKQKEGLEFEGKDPEKFITEYKAKILKDANISVDEKVRERDKTIEGLRKNLGERDTEITTLKTKASQAEADSKLLGLLPKERASILTDQQYLSLIKQEYELTEHEGKPAVKNLKTGEIEKDKTTLAPLDPAVVVKGHFEGAKWIATPGADDKKTGPGGRGASDSTNTGGITNMKQFKDHAKAQGWNLNGQQAQAELNKITTANPNFDFSTAE